MFKICTTVERDESVYLETEIIHLAFSSSDECFKMRFRLHNNAVRVVIELVREEIELKSLEGREVMLMSAATVIQNILWNSVVLRRGVTSLRFI